MTRKRPERRGADRRPAPSGNDARSARGEKLQSARGEKLQKILAGFGLGSRRAMESWIEQGRVKVNGERAHLGQRVDADDRIQVDNGKPLRLRRDYTRVLLLNKAVGTVSTRSDPERRPTIFQGLPRLKQGRWISVGRLDLTTSGLLLLTNNGTLANRLMHPSTGLDREYAARVTGKLDDETLETLKAGVEIEGELHRFSDIQYFDGRGVNHWYHVVLMEGRNREVRRLFESARVLVSRLKRVRYGPVILPPGLPVGQRAELEAEDVESLLSLVGLDDELAGAGGKSRSTKRPRPAPKGPERRRRTVLTAYPDLDLS
ncbi:MAG: pseudouridine synthase [Pseudomonadota bacterium]